MLAWTQNVDDLVIRLGAIAAALAAIAALTRMIVRWMVKQFTAAVRTEMDAHVGPRIDKVYENTLELRPNGGSSLADAVRRLEDRQLKVMQEQRRQARELRKHQAAQDSLRQTLLEHLQGDGSGDVTPA